MSTTPAQFRLRDGLQSRIEHRAEEMAERLSERFVEACHYWATGR